MKPVLLLKFPYSSRFGGGEQHTLLLARELDQRGTPFFFCGSCSVLLKEFRDRGWHATRFWAGKEPVAAWSLVLFPLTAPFAFVALAIALLFYRFAKKTRTLYCISFTEKVLLTPFARLLGMTVLWVEHIEVRRRRWLTLNPLRLPYRWWSRLATIIVISRVIESDLVAMGVSPDRIRVVYNGIDLTPYANGNRRMSHWTKQFTVGAVARLEPEKGIAYLLRAFQKLLTVIPHARLLIVGDGSERKQLEWLGRQLGIGGQVQWVGFQKNIPGWMKHFDCFVLPSVGRESFGIVLLEAMASACPVVASNLGGIPEIVQNNQTGILVEPADSELLMQALLFLYRHPDMAMQLGLRGRVRVEEHFSLERSLEQLLAFFP